jgi:ArsR family transcriptional regulator, arsenate/arsenite/antimonite-responsive transcriptional repressor
MLQSPQLKQGYDRFLRTLCNKTRLSLIQALQDNDKNVTELTQELGIHQTSVSHALKVLLDCGFVFVEPQGKERVYSLNTKTIKPLLKLMNFHITHYCAKRCS